MKSLRLKRIREALGEASVLFMSNPLPGTKQVMPTEELNRIAEELDEELQELA